MSTLEFIRRFFKHSAVVATLVVAVMITIYGHHDAGAGRMAVLVCVLLAAHIVIAAAMLVMARRSSHDVSPR